MVRAMTASSSLSTTFMGVVYPSYLDHMGHMNVQHYASMFDQATWVFFSIFGITSSYMKDNHKGMAAVSQKTDYLLELFAGDVIEINTRPIEIREKAIKFLHTMLRKPKGEVIATSELTGVHFDTDLHKSCSIPEEIIKRIEQAIS